MGHALPFSPLTSDGSSHHTKQQMPAGSLALRSNSSTWGSPPVNPVTPNSSMSYSPPMAAAKPDVVHLCNRSITPPGGGCNFISVNVRKNAGPFFDIKQHTKAVGRGMAWSRTIAGVMMCAIYGAHRWQHTMLLAAGGIRARRHSLCSGEGSRC